MKDFLKLLVLISAFLLIYMVFLGSALFGSFWVFYTYLPAWSIDLQFWAAILATFVINAIGWMFVLPHLPQ